MRAQQETALERAVSNELRLIAMPGYYEEELPGCTLSVAGRNLFSLHFQYREAWHELSIELPQDYPHNPPGGFFIGAAPDHPFYAFDTDDEMRRQRHTNLANTDRGLFYDRWDCRNTLRDYAQMVLYSLTEEGEDVLNCYMSRQERAPLLLPELERVCKDGLYAYSLEKVTDWAQLATQLSYTTRLTPFVRFYHESKDALEQGLERLARAMRVLEWCVGIKPCIGYLDHGLTRPYGVLEMRRLTVEQQADARDSRWQGYACLFEGAAFERLPTPHFIHTKKETTGVVLELAWRTKSFHDIKCFIWPWQRCRVFDGAVWYSDLHYAESIERLCSLF